MNILNKLFSNQAQVAQQTQQVTENSFVFTKEEYQVFRDNFKKQAKEKNLSARNMILQNIVRGRSPSHGFTPVTNLNKLQNGHHVLHGFVDEEWYLKRHVQADLIKFGILEPTQEQLEAIKELYMKEYRDLINLNTYSVRAGKSGVVRDETGKFVVKEVTNETN